MRLCYCVSVGLVRPAFSYKENPAVKLTFLVKLSYESTDPVISGSSVRLVQQNNVDYPGFVVVSRTYWSSLNPK